MRSLLPIALAGIVIALGDGAFSRERSAATQPPRDPGIAPKSFAFAIGDGQLAGGPREVEGRLGAYDLVVVDGELAKAAEVAALRASGATVLAYLSVGTIERWRSWYPRLKRFRLDAWRDWKGEWFADVSRRKLRVAITNGIAPQLLAKGFDGLFLDNVDMVEVRRHRAQREGMRKLVLDLSALVRGSGGLLFTQNGRWGLRKLGLLEALDGWNREDVTWSYDFDRRRYEPTGRAARRAALSELAAMRRLGLITTAASYAPKRNHKAVRRAVADACGVGALPYVSDIGLTAERLPNPPLTCPEAAVH